MGIRELVSLFPTMPSDLFATLLLVFVAAQIVYSSPISLVPLMKTVLSHCSVSSLKCPEADENGVEATENERAGVLEGLLQLSYSLMCAKIPLDEIIEVHF